MLFGVAGQEFVELLLPVGDQRCKGVFERCLRITGVSDLSNLLLEEFAHAVLSEFGFDYHDEYEAAATAEVVIRDIDGLSKECKIYAIRDRSRILIEIEKDS